MSTEFEQENILSDDTGLDESAKTYFQDDCRVTDIVKVAVHNVNFCYC
jgi:hypothetical protein